MESLNVKPGPNVIAGLKCKVQNIKKYKKRRQVLRQLWKLNKKVNSYIPDGVSTKINPMLILQAKQSPLFPMLMCKLL